MALLRQRPQLGNKKGKGGSSTAAATSAGGDGNRMIVLVSVLLVTILLVSVIFPQPIAFDDSTSLLRVTPKLTSSSATTTATTTLMREWRTSGAAECQSLLSSIKTDDADALDRKEALERTNTAKMTFNKDPSTTSSSKDVPYRYCKNGFIDLGTNIGDSIGYFVDNALDFCSPLWVEDYPKTKFTAEFPRPHLDVTTLEVSHRGAKPNPLFGLLQRNMRGYFMDSSKPSSSSNNAGGPETFCVYGMEGNPTFTDRLTKLENFIMDMQPRPVSHIHIFTESVVTATDGPTKLYLDKTSVEQNFWGSSILSSQQDAVKTAKELNDGSVVSADVMGISLSSMVRSTMLAFKDGSTGDDQKDGLLIIKMDVEGAEYQVLKEVAASNVLCDLIKMGNRVVLVVEYHNMSITDPEERKREKDGSNEAKKKLEDCGVQFQTLHAGWH